MHWTYASFQERDDLEQGDILAPTQELRSVLEKVHEYFCAAKYLAFQITTQSCDLSRRGSDPPKAQHINIAAVRSLKEVMPRVYQMLLPEVGPGIFRKSDKYEATKFLRRLFNQNEQSAGLFYLHAESEIEIGEPAIAFLRVTIALKAQHYPILMAARRGRLTNEFRAKFGWLVGNLYSRAATMDWNDIAGGKEELQDLVDEHLGELLPGRGPMWLEDDLVEAGMTAGVDFANTDKDGLSDELEKHRPQPRIDQAIDAVIDQVAKVLAPCDDKVTKLRNRLTNDRKLRKLVKPR